MLLVETLEFRGPHNSFGIWVESTFRGMKIHFLCHCELCKVACVSVGLGVVSGERSFFHKNERNDPIIPKKNERIEHVLKNIVTICKGTERERNN